MDDVRESMMLPVYFEFMRETACCIHLSHSDFSLLIAYSKSYILNLRRLYRGFPLFQSLQADIGRNWVTFGRSLKLFHRVSGRTLAVAMFDYRIA